MMLWFFFIVFFQIMVIFDMIGYLKWIEDLEQLDKYYENVSGERKVGLFRSWNKGSLSI